MITACFVQTMARYNQWQNESIYKAADLLDEKQRRRDQGAFFKSIHETLSHVLWGDRIWMNRFAETPVPTVQSIAESPAMVSDWGALKKQRVEMDQIILDWSQTIPQDFLNGDLTWYSGAAGREMVKPKAALVMHMFNHQTHHRGQVHAMITSMDGKPDDTDLFFIV